MIGTLMMRVSAVILCVGMVAGIAMGIAEDFRLASAHAHLNLIGGVLLFICGLFYNLNPRAGRSRLAFTQGMLHIVAAIIFPVGIGAVMLFGHALVVLPIVGSFAVIGAMLLFAVVVFKSTAGAT
ncbi:hypothetical protein [Bradyrhizobium sp.]|uniref:hypothetical protein n=1 Tax=Bradyrhizobium sp. TaxID=376 RepID=UPI0039E51A78